MLFDLGTWFAPFQPQILIPVFFPVQENVVLRDFFDLGPPLPAGAKPVHKMTKVQRVSGHWSVLTAAVCLAHPLMGTHLSSGVAASGSGPWSASVSLTMGGNASRGICGSDLAVKACL